MGVGSSLALHTMKLLSCKATSWSVDFISRDFSSFTSFVIVAGYWKVSDSLRDYPEFTASLLDTFLPSYLHQDVEKRARSLNFMCKKRNEDAHPGLLEELDDTMEEAAESLAEYTDLRASHKIESDIVDAYFSGGRTFIIQVIHNLHIVLLIWLWQSVYLFCPRCHLLPTFVSLRRFGYQRDKKGAQICPPASIAFCFCHYQARYHFSTAPGTFDLSISRSWARKLDIILMHGVQAWHAHM